MTLRSGNQTTVFGSQFGTALEAFMPWVWSNGGDLLTSDGAALALDQPAAIEAIQFLVDLRFKYNVAAQAKDLANTNAQDFFKNDHFDYLYAYPWLISAASKAPDDTWLALRYFEDVAMPKIVQAGALQGSKIADEKIFLDPNQPPKHGSVLVDAVANHGRLLPLVTNYPEFSQAVNKELAGRWNGTEQNVATAIARLKGVATPLITAGRFQRWLAALSAWSTWRQPFATLPEPSPTVRGLSRDDP